MLDDDKILELDYSSTSKSRKFLIGFTTYILLIVFFNLLSSYKNPTIRIENKLISIHTYEFQRILKKQVESLNNQLFNDSVQDLNLVIKELLVKFYEERNYNAVWIDNFNTNERFSVLLNLLDSSAYFGFPFDYFNVSRIHELTSEFFVPSQGYNHQEQKIELELTATFSALKFILYLKHGIIEKDTSKVYLTSIETLPEILNQAINQKHFRDDILAAQPNLVNHRNLLKSLSYFIDLHYSVKYTTPAFIDDKLLAKSLYYAEMTKSPVFDSTNPKMQALNNLAEQFNLPKDSILNIPSHVALVSLLEYKYILACLNINRLRKLKHSGENYLFVNIPEFKLHVVESNEEKETFNVIVGKKITPTPVFSSSIEQVVANPYWTVPKSIVNNEMIYKIRKDSTYLRRNGFFIINGREETVDESVINWNSEDPLGNKYYIRQINSKNNALGQIKFIFPNDYSVYLHDTPSKNLFSRENRTFSHGCIRLENPNKLAQYLTDIYHPLDKYDIDKMITENEHQVIDLAEKINIHIQYITCAGINNEDMMFYKDIYNLDKEEIKAIFPNLPGI
ncbi:MAG TPA: hypothetical protein DCG75_02740 [Bacteroidales bacterium]|nr:hypothetical protein [Bacteroidales bacterium]